MQSEDYRHMFKKNSKIIRTSTVVVLPDPISPTPTTPENTEAGHDSGVPRNSVRGGVNKFS